MDRPPFFDLEDLVAVEVEAFAEHVEDVPLRRLADRHGDGRARVRDEGPAHEAVGRFEGDGSDDVVSQVLGDLERHVV